MRPTADENLSSTTFQKLFTEGENKNDEVPASDRESGLLPTADENLSSTTFQKLFTEGENKNDEVPAVDCRVGALAGPFH